MTADLDTILAVFGFIYLFVGISMISISYALIVSGVLLITLAYLVG